MIFERAKSVLLASDIFLKDIKCYDNIEKFKYFDIRCCVSIKELAILTHWKYHDTIRLALDDLPCYAVLNSRRTGIMFYPSKNVMVHVWTDAITIIVDMKETIRYDFPDTSDMFFNLLMVQELPFTFDEIKYLKNYLILNEEIFTDSNLLLEIQ